MSGDTLVALGTAAVIAIYAAGYQRTKPAADLLERASRDRRSAPAPVATPLALSGDTVAQLLAVVANTQPHESTEKTDSVAVPVVSTSTTPTNKKAVVKTDTGSAPAKAAEDAPPVVDSPQTPTQVPTQVPKQAPVTAAGAATPPVDTVVEPPKPAYHDGMFIGYGTSRHGDIEAMIEIKDGRIISAVINRCLTRYSCSWIAKLPPQVVERQSADVDYVSGATQSANAFYYAVAQALEKAK